MLFKLRANFIGARGCLILIMSLMMSCGNQDGATIGHLTLSQATSLGLISNVKGINTSTDGSTEISSIASSYSTNDDCVQIEYNTDFSQKMNTTAINCNQQQIILDSFNNDNLDSFRATRIRGSHRQINGEQRHMMVYESDRSKVYMVDPNFYLDNYYTKESVASHGSFLYTHSNNNSFYAIIYIWTLDDSPFLSLNTIAKPEKKKHPVSKISVGNKINMCSLEKQPANDCTVTLDIYNKETNQYDSYSASFDALGPQGDIISQPSLIRLDLMNQSNEKIGFLTINFDGYIFNATDLNGTQFTKW